MVFVYSAFIVMSVIIFISEPLIIRESFYRSFQILSESLIPAVFPFMIITQIIAVTKIKDVLSYPVKLLFRVFHLPKNLAGPFLCSSLGGYYSGVKALIEEKNEGIISKDEAERFIPFVINAGPGFAVLAVGYGMYNSYIAGIVFYISQLISSLLIGKLLYGNKILKTTACTKYKSFQNAIIDSVSDSSESMLLMSGFVVFFSLFNSIITYYFGNNILTLVLISLLEVTNGCKSIADNNLGVSFCSFLISFGGFSVLYQIKSFCKKAEIEDSGIITVKFTEAVLTGILTYIYIKAFPFTSSTASVICPPLSFYSSNRILVAILIAMMFVEILVKADYSRH